MRAHLIGKAIPGAGERYDASLTLAGTALFADIPAYRRQEA
jgi:hypothetical protein